MYYPTENSSRGIRNIPKLGVVKFSDTGYVLQTFLYLNKNKHTWFLSASN